MVIKIEESNLVYYEFSADMIQSAKDMSPFLDIQAKYGFKYLGFSLKPNSYSFQDWVWLYKKIENLIST